MVLVEFAERLAGPVDRFLTNLAVERPVWRANWSVVEEPTLFHPHARVPRHDLTPEAALTKMNYCHAYGRPADEFAAAMTESLAGEITIESALI